jgi:hypothetical protein
MARISTYIKDLQITSDDKLLGSNYGGLDNQGRPIFTTANYKISDLLTYFSENIDIGGGGGGSLGLLLDDLNKVKTFFSYDENGILTGISQAFVGLYANSAVANNYATATFQANVEAKVVQFDENGNISLLSTAFANDIITATTTDRFATSQKVNNLGAAFGTFDGEDFTIAEANIQSIFDTFTGLSFANSQYITNIESNVAGKPLVFRQDAEPAIYDGVDQVIPDGSIWYDTDDDNKVYIAADDPENAGTSIWTLTEDSRIGATASKITNMAASFGSFDANNNFTIDANAGYGEAIVLKVDTDSATATKITNLSADLGTFDENNNFTTSFSAGLKQAIRSDVDTNSATAGYVDNLGAAVGIDKQDGSTLQASASVNGANTGEATTATVETSVTNSKVIQLVDAVSNESIEVGQYVTFTTSESNVNDTWRVVDYADSTNTLELDKEVTLATGDTLSFEGTSVIAVDDVSGTIRNGFQVKGTGITIGTYVVDYTAPNLTLSRAESLTDDTVLEFLGVYAAVTQTASVLADVDGNLKSSYGLQVDANGNVAGMKLLADNNGSEISFLADSFKVYNGTTGEAPFIVEDNTVKIKSANIQQISFGDLRDIPDFFIVTTVYADDALGTNASTTKGTKNFYGIYQGQAAWEDGDSVEGITFNQITGDPGGPGASAYLHIKYSNDNGATFTGNDGNDVGDYIGTYTDNNETASTDVNDYTWIKIIGQDGVQGPTGDRVYTTNLFYQIIVTGDTVPTFDTTNLAYDFDTAEWSGIPDDWGINPPSSSPGSGTNKLYYVSASAVEGDGVTVGNPTTYFNFNGLVTFTGDGNNVLSDGTSNFDYTAIDGAWITTGAIKSNNFAYTDANSNTEFDEIETVTAGTIFNLIDGYIKTPKFWLHSDGNAYFTGDLTGATGTFSDTIRVGSGDGQITIDSSGISTGSGNFGIDASGNATLQGEVRILDADNDTVVKIHDGDFIGTESTSTSATFPDVNEITITTWDASDTTVSTSNGVTRSSLRDDTNAFLYSDVKWVQFPAGTTTHTLTTAAITDPIATLSSDYYGFMRVQLGVEFGNADFSTIYYSQVFPNANYEADGQVTLPAYTQDISLTFTAATNVYVRFYLQRLWKLQVGSATFAERTFSVTSNLSFTGIKGKTELSPNGLQVLNSNSVYFKIDRKNFNSGNPYVDIGGDVLIDGNLEVTGNINISGDVENSDVSVENLEDRLAEIVNNTYIGSSSGTATFTVRDNLIVDGNLTVNGETTTISATNLSVEDNMIYLNAGSAVTNPDLGIAGNYNDGSYAHAGIFRDASDGKWKFYDGYTPEPDASTAINTGHSSFNLATVNAGSFVVGNGSSTGFLKANGTIDTTTYITSNDISAFLTLADLTSEDVDVTSLKVGGTTVINSSRDSYLNSVNIPNNALYINSVQVTADAADLNKLDGMTSTTAELNKLDGFTGGYTDLNYAKDLRATGITATEFSRLDGVESNIQTQIDNIDAFLYVTQADVSKQGTSDPEDGWFRVFEVESTDKGGVSTNFHVRTKRTNADNSTYFEIVTSDDGKINVNAIASGDNVLRYIIRQDADNPQNYQFYVRNTSVSATSLECFIFDINKKGDVGSGVTRTKLFSTYTNTKDHEILEFTGHKITKFDTSVTGTTTVDASVQIDGELTVKSINLTGLSSTGGRTTETTTVLIDESGGSYSSPRDVARLLTPPGASARSFMKFTVYGEGEFVEKKYVCDWNNTASEWKIAVATEESSGTFDIQYDFNDDKFKLHIVDGSTPVGFYAVSITIDHLGENINYESLA